MKAFRSLKFILIAWALCNCIDLGAQISQIEPPFWWAGMHDSGLQLMLHGSEIADADVEFSYDGVTLVSVSRTQNPNYLFIDLKITPGVQPGTMDVTLTRDGRSIAAFKYELKPRKEGSSLRQGFDDSDVIYLVMPDRFANGDPSNDQFAGMSDKLNRKDPDGRHGGDLQGIIDHLDYIAGMGFTTLWLNPVLENNQKRGSYHGYAITDFYKVDKRLGSNDDYLRLGETARKYGIKLIMDMVFNHCGSEHWWMDDLPSPDWINAYPDFFISSHRKLVNQDPYASDFDKKRMVDGWFVPSMPDLNQKNPFLKNYLIQNSIWWIEYAGLAGIRMDTYPYPDKEMMSEWNARILKEYPKFTVVGEEWSTDPAVVSYWQKGQINKDHYRSNLTSLMDFPLQNAISKGLTEHESWDSGLINIYRVLADDFIYPDPCDLVVFTDNHDMSRFYMQVGMDEGLYKIGIALLLTTRGIPQVLYGSEIPMTHQEGNNHGFIRKDFPGGWTGDPVNAFTGKGLTQKEADMQKYFRTLLNWRMENPVIYTGKLRHFVPENGMYVYFRFDVNKKYMVILNKNKTRQTLDPGRFDEVILASKTGTDVVSGEQFRLDAPMTIPALSPLILELQ